MGYDCKMKMMMLVMDWMLDNPLTILLQTHTIVDTNLRKTWSVLDGELYQTHKHTISKKNRE